MTMLEEDLGIEGRNGVSKYLVPIGVRSSVMALKSAAETKCAWIKLSWESRKGRIGIRPVSCGSVYRRSLIQ